MCNYLRSILSFVVVLMVSSIAQADLRLVENFETLTLNQNPDGQPCTGFLGGIWDTEVEGTGSIKVANEYDSISIGVNGLSDGSAPRAFGFNGVANPIENFESGIVCLRFRPRISSDGRPFRSFMGLITDTSDDPVNTESASVATHLPLAIQWLSDESGATDILTADGQTVLKADVMRNQWYNVWLVANNTTDTFDFYLRAVEADETVTVPQAVDLVQANIPFTYNTDDPLTGVLVSIPAGVGQGDRVNVSEVWWDGDKGITDPTTATKPVPADRQDDVARDVVLSWKAASLAVAHDVYFGENLEDVANATIHNPRGVLVRAGYEPNTYAPESLLELGKTYYWRVDEVNSELAGSPFVGFVWRFEVEPVAIALTLDNMVEVTASSSVSPAWNPWKTVDGSGLDPNGGHDVAAGGMWAGTLKDGNVVLEYVFDNTYKMYDMQVWNHNMHTELDKGYGVKDVVVSTSTDGLTWTPIPDITIFAQATGLPGYQANTIINLNGAVADRVRIEASDNWGDSNYIGLSEVAFRYLPTSARLPQPVSGAVGVNPSPDVLLSWRPGRSVAQHVLYLSTDEQAVIERTADSIALVDDEYSAKNLDVNAVYYWCVDEVNGIEVWPGPVWTLSTEEAVGIDDFESYTNDHPNMVFQTWVDGLGINGDDWVPSIPSIPSNGTGAIVGHDIWNLSSPHYLKTIIDRDNPHSGVQCMPLYYQNSSPPYVSEATRTFDSVRNWTENGVDSLAFWYLGSSSVDSFSYDSNAKTYSVIAGGGNIAPAGGHADTFHFVYKELSGNGEMIVKVESVDLVDPWSKAGIMIRQGLETGARHAFVGLNPSGGVTFAWRKIIDGASDSTDVIGDIPPYWIKLVRNGSTMSSFMSPDGTNWEFVGSATVNVSGDVYIGMAVSSHESRTDPLCEAIFSNVQTSGGIVPGEFTMSASVSEEMLNMPERLYVTISDAAGKSVETEIDATGSSVNEWTLGTLDLTALSSGVDLTQIEKVSIGIGDGVAGSDGMILIDDLYLFREN